MKNVYPILIALLYCISLSAQPVITENIIPEFGDNWTITFFETTNFDQGSSGANQNWDFSNLDISNSIDIEVSILAPSTVLGASNFPDATFAWHLGGFDIYEFYMASESEIALVGGVSISSNEIDFMTIFTNTEDGFQLPINFGDSYSYDSHFEQYLFGSYLGEYDRTGNVTADAYGTLTTPNGTYENLLRLKIEETSFGFTSTQYAWMDVNNFTPVMVYESSDDPDTTPSIYFTSPNVSSSLKQTAAGIPEMSAWYMASENQIQISMPAEVSSHELEARLYRIDGQLLATQALTREQLQSIVIPSVADCETVILTVSGEQVFESRKITVCR